MHTLLLHTLADTHTLVSHVLSILPQKTDATTIALSGELGAGKTTFVQTLAQELGITEHVTSPTFVIMKRYTISQHAQFETLVHIDAYRVESLAELTPLRISELFENPTNLICIEWPDRIADILPRDRLEVRIEHDPTTATREATYGYHQEETTEEKAGETEGEGST